VSFLYHYFICNYVFQFYNYAESDFYFK